jgi:BCD family chlorophyll transporter-like MFS transporter
VALGGAIRDAVSSLATQGALGPVLATPSLGYSLVYQIEIVLLFAALIAVGPLVRTGVRGARLSASKFGLAEFPS